MGANSEVWIISRYFNTDKRFSQIFIFVLVLLRELVEKNTGYQSDSGLNTCNLSHQPIELPEATTEVEKSLNFHSKTRDKTRVP